MKPFTRSPHPAGGVLRDAITVRVTDAGYEPDTVVVSAERRARIVSTRETASPCAADVTFPDLAVSAKLPVGESVLVELPAAAGEHTFQCAMGMLRGRLIAAEEHHGSTDADHTCLGTEGDRR